MEGKGISVLGDNTQTSINIESNHAETCSLKPQHREILNLLLARPCSSAEQRQPLIRCDASGAFDWQKPRRRPDNRGLKHNQIALDNKRYNYIWRSTADRVLGTFRTLYLTAWRRRQHQESAAIHVGVGQVVKKLNKSHRSANTIGCSFPLLIRHTTVANTVHSAWAQNR